jgi:hypothetical protein
MFTTCLCPSLPQTVVFNVTIHPLLYIPGRTSWKEEAKVKEPDSTNDVAFALCTCSIGDKTYSQRLTVAWAARFILHWTASATLNGSAISNLGK